MNFEQIYENRPDKAEVGSSGYSNLRNLYDLCERIKPNEIVESGTWKGNSSWLFYHFAPVICHDIDFGNLKWRHDDIEYGNCDITECEDYYRAECMKRDPYKLLFFFDDHISQLQRLEWLIKIGAKHAVFDDNQPGHIARSLKNPPSPTLEELREQNHPIMEQVKHYEVMPFHDRNRRNFDTRLTYIKL